jgi:hypothetical protein
MSDRIRVQVQFRKALWICDCGQDDITDLNVGTPSVYEHNCSACNKWSNNFKEYNGHLSYGEREYPELTERDIDDAKKELVDKWVLEVKNPPAPHEVTEEDLLREKAQLEEQIADVERRIQDRRR